jgi:hypothetical protein
LYNAGSAWNFVNVPPPPPPPPWSSPSGARRRLEKPRYKGVYNEGYSQQRKIADIMLYPVSAQEKLFSLSTRDWLNKAFLASGVGSGLPTRPGSTASSILHWEGTKYSPYPESGYPEVVGLPYKMGRKASYATGPAGVTSGSSVVKTLPQRMRDSFNDGSLNLPEQCLWHMELQGNCHDASFKLKSPLSGKYLAHPNMAGSASDHVDPSVHPSIFDSATSTPANAGLVLSSDKYTPLSFASGLSDDKVTRWTGSPFCTGKQPVGASMRKNCLPEHKCGMCATGYADCNTACADPSVPWGTTGSPAVQDQYNLSMPSGKPLQWGGADVCHRAPEFKVTQQFSTSSWTAKAGPTPPKGWVTGQAPVKYTALQISLQQHKKDSVKPQLFNVTLTYLRQGVLGPVTRSHLLAYEAGASIALEQIKGVPCSGPIILTAAACVEEADSRVNCDFPATRKTLSNPCHADDVREEAAAPPLVAPSATAPVRPAAAGGDSLALPTHPAATSTALAAPTAQASTGATTLAPEADGDVPAARSRPRLHHHLSHPLEVVIGLSLVLLLSASCFLLVRRSFRPTLRSEQLLDQEGMAGVRYDKRPAISKV